MNALEQQIATFLAKKGITNPIGDHNFEKGNYNLNIEFKDGKNSIFDDTPRILKYPVRRIKEEYIKDGQLLSELTQLSGPVWGFSEGWKDRDRNRYEKNMLLVYPAGDYYVERNDVLNETKISAESVYNHDGKFKLVMVWAFKEDGRCVRRDLYFPDLINPEPDNYYLVNNKWDHHNELANERILDIDFSYDEKEVRAVMSKEGKPWYNLAFSRNELSLKEKVEQLLAEFS